MAKILQTGLHRLTILEISLFSTVSKQDSSDRHELLLRFRCEPYDIVCKNWTRFDKETLGQNCPVVFSQQKKPVKRNKGP